MAVMHREPEQCRELRPPRAVLEDTGAPLCARSLTDAIPVVAGRRLSLCTAAAIARIPQAEARQEPDHSG